jgi:thioredoxin:protein disulfide reductase
VRKRRFARLATVAALSLAAFALLVAFAPTAHADSHPLLDESGRCIGGVAAGADGSGFATYEAKGWLWMYLGAFGFGFLTSLTPCVYPMIPIVLGVFGARDEASSRRRAFVLATCYVGGMGLTYSILGVVFALLGKQFGTILAEPWVVIPICLIYLALAASMFGAFELNLPSSLQNRLNQVGGRGFFGAFAMGLVGGLTAAPCTGPFLAGILGFVAKTRNVPGGFTLLFSYAIGMGILFWVLAVFAVSLPKSGRWMEWVKSIGGVALLAAALYFLRPVAPVLAQLVSNDIVFLIAAIAMIAAGVALGAVHLSFHDSWPVRARKAFAVLLMVAGITAAVNWIVTPSRHLPWQLDETTAFAQARAEKKGVMVDFAASWCGPCLELEHTFGSPDVYENVVENFVPLKFDVSKETELTQALQKRYGAETLPAVFFLDTEGRPLGKVRTYLPREEFLGVLCPAVAGVRGGTAPSGPRTSER